MAFNRERGAELRAHWDAIPSGIDLLITHGPPRGLGDRMVLGPHVGCDDLRARVLVLAPRAHVFGHIHEAFGRYAVPGTRTQFVNAANSHFLPVGVRAATELRL
jgi:Icc-related predicted phosphoesterase